MKTLPKINRHGWLATWLQQRRRHRRSPLLRPQYPSLAVWEWPYPDPARWNAYLSLDGGHTFQFDDWVAGNARQYAPDSGTNIMFIVGVNEAGNEITGHSNAVRPDDAGPAVGSGLSSGLVARFGLDEASGDWVDSVGGKILTAIGGTPQRVAGLHGQAVKFVGDGASLVSTADTTVFSPSAPGFTVSMWVNFSAIADPSQPLYLASVWQDADWPAGSSWHIYSASPADGQVGVEVLGSGLYSLSGTVDFTAGWVHIGLVYEPVAGQWTLYLNGAAAMSDTFDFSPVAGRLGIGAHTQPATAPAQGIYDEVAFWSRALSAAEMTQLYNSGAGVTYPY